MQQKERGNIELALGGCCIIFRHNNLSIVIVSDGRDDGEDAWPGQSVWGGLVSLFGVAN